MGELIRKSHSASLLMHHFVCVAKHRRLATSEEVDSVLQTVCLEISKRHEIYFLEIGTESDHGHFLVQSVPTYSPTMTAMKIRSMTAREIFFKVPSVEKQLWGGEFWTDGYFVSTVSDRANEDVVRHCIKNQGRTGNYRQLHRQQPVFHEQLMLF